MYDLNKTSEKEKKTKEMLSARDVPGITLNQLELDDGKSAVVARMRGKDCKGSHSKLPLRKLSLQLIYI